MQKFSKWILCAGLSAVVMAGLAGCDGSGSAPSGPVPAGPAPSTMNQVDARAKTEAAVGDPGASASPSPSG